MSKHRNSGVSWIIYRQYGHQIELFQLRYCETMFFSLWHVGWCFDTHEHQLRVLWRRSQWEAQIKMTANSVHLIVETGNKTLHHSSRIHPKLIQSYFKVSSCASPLCTTTAGNDFHFLNPGRPQHFATLFLSVASQLLHHFLPVSIFAHRSQSKKKRTVMSFNAITARQHTRSKSVV